MQRSLMRLELEMNTTGGTPCPAINVRTLKLLAGTSTTTVSGNGNGSGMKTTTHGGSDMSNEMNSIEAVMTKGLDSEMNGIETGMDLAMMTTGLDSEMNGIETGMSSEVNGIEAVMTKGLDSEMNGIETGMSSEMNGIETVMEMMVIKKGLDSEMWWRSLMTTTTVVSSAVDQLLRCRPGWMHFVGMMNTTSRPAVQVTARGIFPRRSTWQS
jgi:hypothetical protein